MRRSPRAARKRPRPTRPDRRYETFSEVPMFLGKRISVVIPCHNEEEGVRAVIEQMPPIVDEILVVDNCSTDRTAEVARSLGARVVHESRKGYGRAYKTGFEKARGDIIVTMDGDGTY